MNLSPSIYPYEVAAVAETNGRVGERVALLTGPPVFRYRPKGAGQATKNKLMLSVPQYAGAGRADHEDIVAAGRGHGDRPLHRLLAADLGEVQVARVRSLPRPLNEENRGHRKQLRLLPKQGNYIVTTPFRCKLHRVHVA